MRTISVMSAPDGRGGHAQGGAQARAEEAGAFRVGRVDDGLMAEAGERVAELQRMHHAAARIGGMGEDGDAQRAAHAASSALREGQAAAEQRALREIPDRFARGAVRDGDAAVRRHLADGRGCDAARFEQREDSRHIIRAPRRAGSRSSGSSSASARGRRLPAPARARGRSPSRRPSIPPAWRRCRRCRPG